MDAPRQPDLRTVLQLVRDLHDAADVAGVQAALLRHLPRLSPRDSSSWAARDGDLDDGDRELLELVRPHLQAAVRRAGEREHLSRFELTSREREVLQRVAEGETNVVIARRLAVSPRTVEKHLEHAYAKLGVASRTAAVARLRGITR